MSVKISELSASVDITSDDFFPIVDSGSLTTKRANAQQMLDYVTGSTFDTLTVTSLSGTTAQFTTITGSTVTGTAAQFTTISASNLSVSGGNAVFYESAIIDDYAYILYNSSIDKLTIFPGLYITGALTASTVISAPTGAFDNITGPAGNINVSGSMSGMVAALTSSASNYTLVPADSGKVVVLSSSTGITASVPTGLPVGFTTTIVQNGSGSIFVSASSGVVIRNRQSHTKTAGLYAVATLIGTGSNSYILAGDTTT